MLLCVFVVIVSGESKNHSGLFFIFKQQKIRKNISSWTNWTYKELKYLVVETSDVLIPVVCLIELSVITAISCNKPVIKYHCFFYRNFWRYIEGGIK